MNQARKTIQTSVIIPNYNGMAYIDNCIKSLLPLREDQEIIVIDDGSSDNSKAYLKDLKEKGLIRFYENQENKGFAYSVNRGITEAQGQFVLLLNNDVVVEKGFVANLTSVIQAKANAFSVSSKMVRFYERTLLDDIGDNYTILGWAYKRGDGKPLADGARSSKIFSTCAGAGIYRKSVIEKIGGFDESFFAYLEDVDLSYRGKLYGYTNYYTPKAVCYHIGSATTADGKKYSPFKVSLSARNNVYLAYKNMPTLQLILNAPFLLLGHMIKGVYFQIIGYGSDYRSGLWEGLTTMGCRTKTPTSLKKIPIYLKIQIELLVNMFKYIKEKW